MGSSDIFRIKMSNVYHFLGSHDFEDGYALWKNREATEMVNNATKSLPKTQGPSHFVLTAHKELPEVFPTEVLTVTK